MENNSRNHNRDYLIGELPRQMYIDLLKKVLTRFIGEEKFEEVVYNKNSWQEIVTWPFRRSLAFKNYILCKRIELDTTKRTYGLDWPSDAETMVGLCRLENIEHCVKEVISKEIPGDFLEAGVWRGGCCIFMRGILRAYDDTKRTVWVADSFEGLPKSTHQEDLSWQFDKYHQLAVSLEQVKDNFRKYDLLDNQVKFLKGWFKDSLPSAPIERIAILRMDGDLYESTWDSISNLYPKVSVGGYVIVDDYGGIDSCRKAIDEYRNQHDIVDPIQKIDQTGVFWQKTQ
jgi:O-methyltransferase